MWSFIIIHVLECVVSENYSHINIARYKKQTCEVDLICLIWFITDDKYTTAKRLKASNNSQKYYSQKTDSLISYF